MNGAVNNSKAHLLAKLCMEIEGGCAELYHCLSEIHRNDPHAARLWKKTALEVENHRKLFELAVHLMDEVECEFVTANMERALIVHQKLHELLHIVKKNPPNLITALGKAIEMEKHIADLHVESLVHFKNEGMRRMFDALYRADQDHIGSLERYLASISPPPTGIPAM